MTQQRILVIDDEPAFATFLRRSGERLGHTVRIAADAADFKALYPHFKPSIVVLDIVMPDVDGIELIQWLAKTGSRAKVIVISGANPLYRQQAKAIGETHRLAMTSLAKPISLADLEAAFSSASSS
jgi:DNA-binding NtrC family response regulator